MGTCTLPAPVDCKFLIALIILQPNKVSISFLTYYFLKVLLWVLTILRKRVTATISTTLDVTSTMQGMLA